MDYNVGEQIPIFNRTLGKDGMSCYIGNIKTSVNSVSDLFY